MHSEQTRQQTRHDSSRPATSAGAPNDSARLATIRADVTATEDAWGNAMVKKDSATMGRLMADEYVSLGPDGDSTTKQAVLREMTSNTYNASAVTARTCAFKR